MAKQKRVKPQYVPKANRPKKPLSKAHKIELAIVAGAMLLAVVLFFTFYSDGSLPMIDGVAQREDNWVIQNLGADGKQKYYKLAEYEIPEGYYRDTESSTSTNKNRVEFWMRPVDETSAVKYGYVIGVSMPPEEIAVAGHDALVGFNDGQSTVGDVSHATLRGIEVPYFTNIITNTDTGEVNKQLNAYLPAPHNAGVMVAVSKLVDEANPEPSDEELLALAEFFAATLQIEEQ
ncbi:MAG: hypothetical protein LBN04_05915 [Oscillospiraceae bacterium]|jgi:hypothetical protein|nr:hypothetical protein [Oscillospiraceae bacterium]